MKRLLRFIQPSDFSPLLLFHVGTNSNAGGDLVCTKHDYMSLEARGKGTGCKVVFSLFMLTKENSLRRTGWILWINN